MHTTEIPIPRTWGEDAAVYLEASGLTARTPTVRSSDYEMCLKDPFRYYLTRRLGLCDALRHSPALNQGGWFHKAFEYLDFEPQQLQNAMEEALLQRFEELKVVCKTHSIGDDKRRLILEREERDCRSALGWFDAMKTVVIPNYDHRTALDMMQQKHFRCIARELRLIVNVEECPGVSLVAQFDALLYHEAQNTLWIVDPKTCHESTIVRLATCPIEFQTQHYLFVLKVALQLGSLQQTFNLPADVRVGGMMHVAIQKPTISFGTKDRDCTYTTRVITRGKRKGQTVREPHYEGEPRYANYIDRCRSWYLAEGEYAHLKDARLDDPPVNISFTDGLYVEDPNVASEYLSRLHLIWNNATMKPWPSNYFKNPGSLRTYGKLDTMTPFYTTHPKEWPALVAQLRMTRGWRDEDLLRTPHEPAVVDSLTPA